MTPFFSRVIHFLADLLWSPQQRMYCNRNTPFELPLRSASFEGAHHPGSLVRQDVLFEEELL